MWKEDPIAVAIEAQRATLKLPFQSLTEKKKLLGERPGSSDRGEDAVWTEDGKDG